MAGRNADDPMRRVRRAILRREIMEQPGVLDRILARESKRVAALAVLIKGYAPRYIQIVARGSADNAGRYGKYLFGAFNRLVVAMATPSLVTRYRRPPDLGQSLVLAISQSGESCDVVEVVEAARRSGALTVALTNAAGSPLARAANVVLLCHAGRERSLAATKTYTAQLMLLAMLSTALEGSESRWEALRRIPEQVDAALHAEEQTARIAERLRYLEHCVVVGRGFNHGSTFEVALKLQELTYLVAQPYSSADFRHGPIAVVDQGFCVLTLAPTGRVLGDLRQLLRELRARRAETLVLADAPGILRLGTCSAPLPGGVPEWLSPLTVIVPAQLLAMYLCAYKGFPLDRPRGLAKVTRTR